MDALLNPFLQPVSEQDCLEIDRRLCEVGLAGLSAEERFLYIRGVSTLEPGLIPELRWLNEPARKSLLAQCSSRQRDYVSTATTVLTNGINAATMRQLPRNPIPGAPAIIFVANMGAQVPVADVTVGNRQRKRHSLQPPLGQCYMVSYLSLLGIDASLFNLALGMAEYDELLDCLRAASSRLAFISFASNFFGRSEINAVDHLDGLMQKHLPGLSPRLVGGGMGVFFKHETYLRHTALRVAAGRFGEPSVARMCTDVAFDKLHGGVDNVSLFGHIPNLFIADNSARGFKATSVRPLTKLDRQVLAYGFDIRTMQLPHKYWSTGLTIGICSPDDLNIPLSLVDEGPSVAPRPSVGSQNEHYSAVAHPMHQSHWISSQDRGDDALHISNYICKPKTVKVMSVFGNCPRACKFCQFTKFDPHTYFISGKESVDHFNATVEIYPDLQMFVLDDDDFLLRRRHCLDLINELKRNKPTRGKVFYVETVPMEIDAEIMRELRAVGFRAILLGIEVPVERVARQVGKLMPHHSFEKFLNAPYVTNAAGFFTRATSIPFYPSVQEADLVEVIERLTDYISQGISVSVFPLVKALPGTEFVEHLEHDTITSRVLLPNRAEELEVLEWLLPDDRVVRDVALQCLPRTEARLNSILEEHGIRNDYPTAIGVLAMFRTALEVWSALDARTLPLDRIAEARRKVDEAIAVQIQRHRTQVALQRHAWSVASGCSVSESELRPLFREATLPHLLSGLRLMVDFGNDDEMVAGAEIARWLHGAGVSDVNVRDSIAYAGYRALQVPLRSRMDRVLDRVA